MGFSDAVSTCFSKYATFSGRAARPEYWYWILFTVVAGLVLAIIQYVISFVGEALTVIFDLATIIPSIAVAARRLHDTDRSGWWQLLVLVPLIGWLLLLVWFCQPGTQGTNRFG